ncbi:MAG: cupin [Myxococcales bacterium]|nr:cupin [Myxococcales bacterium]
MSSLTVYAQDDPSEALLQTSDPERIASALAEHGVRFERWPARAELVADADQASILAAYAPEIERLVASDGYRSCDAISLSPDHPDKDVLREKFLDEHTHSEDEVRFFVDGSGLFCLHLADRVFQVVCERNDLISVPAGTPHWFDMGPSPRFVAIRLFDDPQGWVASFTGSDIAARFPRYE